MKNAILTLILAGMLAANTGALVLLGSLEEKLQVSVAFEPPSNEVSGLAFDGESLLMTVAGDDPAIYKLDPKTGAVKEKLPCAIAESGGSAWDGESLWQLAYEERRFYRIDPKDGSVSDSFPSPGEGRSCGVTFDGRYLWVASFDDKLIYQIDQNDGGRVIQTLRGWFEVAGLAWDGDWLWSGILVGTQEINETYPQTGFVLARDVASGQSRASLDLDGIGAGTSDYLPGGKRATRFWWHDGFNAQIILVEPAWGAAEKLSRVLLSFYGLIPIVGLLIHTRTARAR